ncbi:MAG: PA2169 family four-helix-bundle protein [Phaeodactylibacter sp.]|uniref:PA2169 family four-helix-bundle protein n=1 Tax=Phaeodactylibacter sp. TaxID=1940289 RepID=UPI0032EDE42E
MANNQDKPWNKKRYDANTHASGIALVNNLMMRNKDAEERYREATAVATDESLKAYLRSLAEYRNSLYQQLYKWMDALPPTPMPISKQARSYLYENQGVLRDALMLNHKSKVVACCEASEKSISEAYREAIAQTGVPKDINEFLNGQYQHILKVRRKVERMETVPMLHDNDF